MTRPPNKRVSRGQPVRRGAPAKKNGGCAMALAAAVAVTASGVLTLVGRWHMVPLAWLIQLHIASKAWRLALEDEAPLGRARHGRARHRTAGPGITPAPVHKGLGPATTRSMA